MTGRVAPRRILAVALGAALVVASCAGDSAPTPPTDTGPKGTVGGVGSLPPIVMQPAELLGSTNTLASGASIPDRGGKVGEFAEGPKLLMIGDSILAMLASRYNNKACRALTPLGWQVSVEAVIGKAINFGVEVTSAKLDERWDAFVLFLGTNYWRDKAKYEADLVRILDRLDPRPVVILTSTEYRPEQRDVNDVIGDQVLERDNLWLVDWATISRQPGVLASDEIHPSPEGNDLLVGLLAEVLGRAPGGSTGRCLPSEFVDDEEIPEAIEDTTEDTAVDDDAADDTDTSTVDTVVLAS